MPFTILEILGYLTVVLVLVTLAKQVLRWIVRVRDENLVKEFSLRRFNLQIESDVLQAERNAPTETGWKGYRKFKLTRKVLETHDCVSLYFSPQDGKAIVEALPGQYLTLRARMPGEEQLSVRCYSISDRHHPDYYRLTVKRQGPPSNDPNAPPGVFSSYLCDSIAVGESIDIRAPRGEFVLENSDRPVICIAGGIGITPMIPMLSKLQSSGSKRKAWLFWGVSSFSDLVLSDHLSTIAEKADNLTFHAMISYAHEKQTKGSGDAQRFPVLASVEDDEEYLLYTSDLIVGRDTEAEVTIEGPQLSKAHAQILQRGSEWFIRDLASSNGTFLNGKAIGGTKAAWRTFKLSHNDELRFADKRYNLYLPAEGKEISQSKYEVAGISPRGFMLHKGRIDLDIMQEFAELEDAEFYICGPAGMIEQMSQSLAQAGVPKEDIFVERFGEASVQAMLGAKERQHSQGGAGTACEITFAKSGKKIRWAPRDGSILSAAEQNDIRINHGCRAGQCGSCVARVTKGAVKYANVPTVPIDDDCCLTCTAIPDGDITLDI